MNINNPHKHAAVIKAWADGAAIEYRPSTDQAFEVLDYPAFDGLGEYRVKPAPVKHKWQDCIDAQDAGKQMQLKGPCQEDWEDARGWLMFNDVETLYRVKPKTVNYRLAVVKGVLCPSLSYIQTVAEDQEHESEGQAWFVRWLGPRQTVEI